MSVENGERLVTKQDLADFYNNILPYLGGMPEMVANKFSKGDLYSTEEKMIGQWIDGKPLYQKTFSVTTGNTNVQTTLSNLGSLNIDTMVTMKGQLNNNGLIVTVPSYLTSTGYVGSYYDTTNNRVISFVGSDWYNLPLTFTIQYTKTSDTAISIGSDTDYSTEEKIIGTWIDGKPIYQKTLSVTMPSNGEISIDTTSLNIASLIDAKGWHESNVYGGLIPTPVNNGKACLVFYNKNNGQIYLYNDFTNYGGRNGYLTIQYTKTTT